jgi:hypothetical protein
MPRHPSVPGSLTGWVHLGAADTDTAMFAIVAPELAGILGDEWTARYLDEDGEERPRDLDAGPELHELVEFEEILVGDQGDRAVLITTHSDGGYPVEGRFGDIYGDGHMSLIEVRLRIWVCECSCHGSTGRIDTCDGDCHDEDPGETTAHTDGDRDGGSPPPAA